MRKRSTRKPIIGEAFDSHFMNDSGRIACYVRELRYYRPRGFAALAKEGDKLASVIDTDECDGFDAERMDSWIDEVETLLTDWARRTMRNDYVSFGPFEHCGSVGFYYAVESALDDCDIRLDAGDSVPRGFTGQAAFVTDHGNVTIQTFSRGRKCRELLSVV
jgi:hypothetical protein